MCNKNTLVFNALSSPSQSSMAFIAQHIIFCGGFKMMLTKATANLSQRASGESAGVVIQMYWSTRNSQRATLVAYKSNWKISNEIRNCLTFYCKTSKTTRFPRIGDWKSNSRNIERSHTKRTCFYVYWLVSVQNSLKVFTFRYFFELSIANVFANQSRKSIHFLHILNRKVPSETKEQLCSTISYFHLYSSSVALFRMSAHVLMHKIWILPRSLCSHNKLKMC